MRKFLPFFLFPLLKYIGLHPSRLSCYFSTFLRIKCWKSLQYPILSTLKTYSFTTECGWVREPLCTPLRKWRSSNISGVAKGFDLQPDLSDMTPAWPKRVALYRQTYACMVIACLCLLWVVQGGPKCSCRIASVYDGGGKKHSLSWQIEVRRHSHVCN